MSIPFSKHLVLVTTVLATLGSALMAGVFFSFSNFIMRALAKLPAQNAISAMQYINTTVINPPFMVVFFGTAVCSLGLAVWSVGLYCRPVDLWLFVASLLYLEVVLTTGIFNVPLNDALAKVHPADAEATSTWASYLKSWLFWNHARLLTAFLSSAAFLGSLCRQAQARP